MNCSSLRIPATPSLYRAFWQPWGASGTASESCDVDHIPEPDVEILFRQQFRRDLRIGRFTMEFAQSAPEALQKIVNAGDAALILILSDINMPYRKHARPPFRPASLPSPTR